MLNYKSISKKNPRDLLAPPLHYAAVISTGVSNLEKLSELASRESSVGPQDCYSVLIGLARAIELELKEGRIVELGQLGKFRVSVSSEGSETPEEVSHTSITKRRLIFSPSPYLKEVLVNLKFKKAPNQP